MIIGQCAAAMLRYSASSYQGYAFGLAPCLTADLIRAFIFETSDSAHYWGITGITGYRGNLFPQTCVKAGSTKATGSTFAPG
ncbi:MAG TPA: hypothetical protein VGT81_22460, partial [Casimicrobiaceae bacterium]|nr:hypothetical protein [Casimicrobiaceae bacterium]